MGEVAQIVQGRREYEQARFEATRAANYELARLLSFAVHQPNKMPKYQPVPRAEQTIVPRAPTDADHDRIRAFLISLALRSKKNGGIRDRRAARQPGP